MLTHWFSPLSVIKKTAPADDGGRGVFPAAGRSGDRSVLERDDPRARPFRLEALRPFRFDRSDFDRLARDYFPRLVQEIDLERERSGGLGLVLDRSTDRDLAVGRRELV